MSDTSQGPGWWQTRDGKWYAPERHPDYVPPPTPSPSDPPNRPDSGTTTPSPEPSKVTWFDTMTTRSQSATVPMDFTPSQSDPAIPSDPGSTTPSPELPKAVPSILGPAEDARLFRSDVQPKTPIYKKPWAWVARAVALLLIIGLAIGGLQSNNSSASGNSGNSGNTGNTGSASNTGTTGNSGSATTTSSSATSPSTTQAPQQTPAQYEASAAQIGISQLVNDPSAYNGQVVAFSGTIANFLQDDSGNTTAMNLYDGTDPTSVVYVQLANSADVTQMSKGDNVEVFGVGEGSVSGKNSFGGTVNQAAVTEVYINDLTNGYSVPSTLPPPPTTTTTAPPIIAANYVGMSQQDAESAITAQGLFFTLTPNANCSSDQLGTILSQDPPPGTNMMSSWASASSATANLTYNLTYCLG